MVRWWNCDDVWPSWQISQPLSPRVKNVFMACGQKSFNYECWQTSHLDRIPKRSKSEFVLADCRVCPVHAHNFDEGNRIFDSMKADGFHLIVRENISIMWLAGIVFALPSTIHISRQPFNNTNRYAYVSNVKCSCEYAPLFSNFHSENETWISIHIN